MAHLYSPGKSALGWPFSIVVFCLLAVLVCSFSMVYQAGVRRGAAARSAGEAPSTSYEPSVAADRVRAAQAISGLASATGHSVTEYVDCAQEAARTINRGQLPKYHGADYASIESVAITMHSLGDGELANGKIPTPKELAQKAIPFLEESIPR